MTNRPVTDAPEARPWGWALFWGAVLGLVFFSTYNNVNQYTATLEPVDSVFFAWETRIPLWPWTIVPYWSIDLFYGLALFLATTKTILLRLVKRLLLAQALCISGFLLFPLKFAFVRPPIDGVFGSMFAALAQFDLPYNQAPSLHIVLLLVLWREYRGYCAGSRWRYLVHAWSGLIALSVLTTWQHHFIDLVTGIWVGAFCLLVIPEQPAVWRWSPAPAERRHRLAAFYLLGAMLFGLPAWLVWPGVGAAVLWWIAVALLYVAAVYLWGNAAHLGKQSDGSIPLSHYFFLAPYYLGARINAWYHLRNRPHFSEIVPGVYLGGLSAQATLKAWMRKQNAVPLASVVDLTAELSRAESSCNYRLVPTLDLLPLPSGQLHDAATAIEQAARAGSVLVACALGVSRSAAALAAWLICYRAFSVDDAIALIQQQRPCTIIASHQRDELLKLVAQ